MAVEPGQAGDRVRCECGKDVDIPKLGDLRLRPRIDAADQKSTWSARHGLLTLGGLAVAVSLGLGLYFWATTPDRADYDSGGEAAEIEAYFDALAPWETWRHWVEYTMPLAERGLQDVVTPRSAAFDQQIEKRITHQKLAFGAAGFAVLFCLVVALWRSP